MFVKSSKVDIDAAGVYARHKVLNREPTLDDFRWLSLLLGRLLLGGALHSLRRKVFGLSLH